MFKTRFDRSPTVGVEFKIPTMVQQCDKDAFDINMIIKKYCECGICPTCSSKAPLSPEIIAMSGDDFNTMMQKMAEVNNHFEELPAVVRKKFGNNPANMLEFMQNPDNKEEAVKLGLLDKSHLSSTAAKPDITIPDINTSGSVVNQAGNQTVSGDKETPQVNTGNLSE